MAARRGSVAAEGRNDVVQLTIAALNLDATEVPSGHQVHLQGFTMNERLRILQRQPRRISITLSYHVHESLLQRSEEEGRSMSNLCAFLLEDALRHTSQPMAPMGAINGGNPNNEARNRQRSTF
jgi:hypothetical protein